MTLAGAPEGSGRERRHADPRLSVRIRAALAFGLALGIPAGVTAASWVDAEVVQGSIASSSFVIRMDLDETGGSTDSLLSVPVVDVYPGTGSGARYVSLRVRTTAASVAGTVALSADALATAGLAEHLEYRIVEDASCDASAFQGTPTWIVGDAATAQPVATALPATTPLSLGAAGAGARDLCIELRLPDATPFAGVSGTSGVLALRLHGESS